MCLKHEMFVITIFWELERSKPLSGLTWFVNAQTID